MKTSDHTRALWTISAVVSDPLLTFLFGKYSVGHDTLTRSLSIHAIVKSRFSIFVELGRGGSETGHSDPDVCGRSLIARAHL
jgi:hypothetical protein